MIIGLDKFQEYFKDHANSYIIIGGTACEIIIDTAGLTPRATKDIDIILIVEALDPNFVKQFWKFIGDGNYGYKEKNEEKKNCYRFKEPKTEGFPYQIELLSRVPDSIDHNNETQLTPIPVGEDLSSLSAILMDEEYYNFTRKNSSLEKEVHRANAETLICLKAKAYLNLRLQREKGEKVKGDDIKKHKSDVFRMTLMLAPANRFDLPPTIKADLQEFVNQVKDELPDPAMFKAMGLGGADPKAVFEQLVGNFNLKL